MREIKELYSEELVLLKKIQSYGKKLPQGEVERVERKKRSLSTHPKRGYPFTFLTRSS